MLNIRSKPRIESVLQSCFASEPSSKFGALKAALEKKASSKAITKGAVSSATLAAGKTKVDAFIKNYYDEIKMNEESTETDMFRLEEPKYLFVIRIKGLNKVAPKQKMILRLFRLLQVNNGVFIKCNKATINMLKAIEPYVTYGRPSPEIVKSLIKKRGYLRVKGGANYVARTRISDDLVQQNSKTSGCIDDIVSSVVSVDADFKETNSLLWPFKLQSPRGGFSCKRHAYLEQRPGDWGDRGVAIDDLIRKMM